MQSPRSRLEEIPDEAVLNVIRYLSRAPSKVDWVSSIDHVDALSTLLLPGSLSEISRALFTRLSVGHRRLICAGGTPIEESGTIYLPRDDVGLLTKWLRVCGKGLTSLAFESSMTDKFEDDLRSMLRALEEDCPVLRRLDIRNIGVSPFSRAVLRARDGKLVELAGAGEHSADIERYCRGLRSLVLTNVPANLRDVLRTVGPTLETIEVLQPWACSRADMQTVKELCPKLVHVAFKVERGSPGEPYSDLLQSYGQQLQFASLGRMSKHLCEAVVDACPNLTCEADFMTDSWLDRMLVLAPSLKRLHVFVDAEVDGEKLAEAGGMCRLLEEVQLSTTSERAACAVEEVLSGENPRLTSFKLGLVNKGSANEALYVLGSRATTLDEFCFLGELPDTKAFDAVVEGAPLLQKVCIRLHGPVEHEPVESIVKAFVNCLKLKELRINGSS